MEYRFTGMRVLIARSTVNPGRLHRDIALPTRSAEDPLDFVDAMLVGTMTMVSECAPVRPFMPAATAPRVKPTKSTAGVFVGVTLNVSADTECGRCWQNNRGFPGSCPPARPVMS